MNEGSEIIIKKARGERTDLALHPLSCGINDLKEYVKNMDRPLAVDLFCGAGGLSLGLEQAGYSVILGVDYDNFAIQTHSANFGGASVNADLAESDAVDRISSALSGIDIDLMAGGPPCQPFSSAGRHKIRSLVRDGRRPAHDSRVDLWRSFLEIVSRVKPRSVLIENVPDLALGTNQKVFRSLVVGLEGLGFQVNARILQTWEYGVPQHRRRLFIVGLKRSAVFQWPLPAKGEVHVIDAISDLPVIEGGDFTNPRPYTGARTRFQENCRKDINGEDREKIYDHLTRAVRKDDLEAFKLLGHKSKYGDLPAHLRRYRSDIFKDKYNRLNWNGLSRTITAHIAKDGYWYIHPKQHRTISVREAARLQTFPDNFRFAGYRSNAFRQVGEAVPAIMGRELGKAIINAYSRVPNRTGSFLTIDLSKMIRHWFKNLREDDLIAPWRKSRSMWLALLGANLVQGASPESIWSTWEHYRERWPDPVSFLLDRNRASLLHKSGRKGKSQLMENIAHELAVEKTPKITNGKGTANLSTNMLLMARILSGNDDEIPVLTGTLRVASRIFGQYSPGQDVLNMNGRVLLASILGVEDASTCYAALLEISDQFCLLDEPRCANCPAVEMCRTGSPSKTQALVISE